MIWQKNYPWRKILHNFYAEFFSGTTLVDTKIAIKGEENLKSFYEKINTMKNEFGKIIEEMYDKFKLELDAKFTNYKRKIEEMYTKFKLELDAKFTNYKQKIDDDFAGYSDSEKNAIKDYYKGFSGTFSEAFITSQVINSGKGRFSNDSALWCTALSDFYATVKNRAQPQRTLRKTDAQLCLLLQLHKTINVLNLCSENCRYFLVFFEK